MPHCNEPASVALPPYSNQGLYDPAFERDSCGVGFVADIGGRKSHATIQSGLQVLKNLQLFIGRGEGTAAGVPIEPLPLAVPGT